MIRKISIMCLTIAGIWGAALCATAATLDTLAIDPIRVRSIDESFEVDSVWTDSTWTWDGPCESKERLFRFEFTNGQCSTLLFPCEVKEEEAQTSSGNPQTQTNQYRTPSNLGYGCRIRLSRDSLMTLDLVRVEDSCYPPMLSSQHESLLDAMRLAIFEADKCRLLESKAKESCMTADQIIEALLLLPNEDKRLETMIKSFNTPLFWSEEDLQELFQLNFILNRALRTFETR